MRYWLLLTAIAIVAASAPVAAMAGQPDRNTSTVPRCLFVCPQGEIVSTVIVRDIANNPIVNSTVLIDFSECPGVVLCPPDGTEPYAILPGPKLQLVTDDAGQVVFPIRAGGVCRGEPVITADYFLLRQYPGVASPDQDGNLIVDDRDEAILVEKILRGIGESWDVTTGINCSGGGDALSAFLPHLGHACPGVVPVEKGSWGRLKLRYR